MSVSVHVRTLAADIDTLYPLPLPRASAYLLSGIEEMGRHVTAVDVVEDVSKVTKRRNICSSVMKLAMKLTMKVQR